MNRRQCGRKIAHSAALGLNSAFGRQSAYHCTGWGDYSRR